MLSFWHYNIIKSNREREELSVHLDFVLGRMGNGSSFTLQPGHSEAVSIEEKDEFYIVPTLKDNVQEKDSKLILFSAPGATGKSALARYISRKKNALLWDLSQYPIANHSYSGMLVEALGAKGFSSFTEGLINGNAVLVVDALDEAEMISGRAAIETLLTDLRNAVSVALCPNVVLCARTETAHFIRHFYAQEEHKLEISQYEISFFEDTAAVDFVKTKIAQNRSKAGDNRPVTPATVECIKSLFEEIRRLLDHNNDTIKSFIGYAPVLEALAVYCDEDSNTMQLVQKIQRSNCSAEIFQKIMDHILVREKGKVVNGFKERCSKDYPEFEDWDSVYSEQEQLIRIINYVLFEDVFFDAFSNDNLPKELIPEYRECVISFIKDHPFVHMFDRTNKPVIDFTGPAFRDYVLARLMTELRTSDDCDEYAQSYFGEHCEHARFPSQLYFDLYVYYSKQSMRMNHFKYLYDAFKSKERTKFASSVSIEQVDTETCVVFRQETSEKNHDLHEVEFFVVDSNSPIEIIQLNNGYIDVTADVILGSAKKDVIISNSTIKCKKLLIQSENVMLTADSEDGMLIACSGGVDTSRCPTAKFDIRVDEASSLRISSPDVNDWYKLRKYNYVLDDESDLDATKFEHAVRAILKYFRKDRKDAPGKHKEYIDFVIVGKSPLKKGILEFFISKGIMFQDSKDPRQYKLNNQVLESFGVNWGMLSTNHSGPMQELFVAYKAWLKS